MDNFNLNNIFQKHHHINNQGNSFKTPLQNISNNGINATPQVPQTNLKSAFEPIFQNDSLINPNMLYTLKMAKMDNQEVSKYLQNLLKVPKDIEEFIKNNQDLNLNLIKNTNQVKLIVENMLNIKLLSTYLNDSSKDALQKALQMLSNAMKTGVQPEQLKEIVSILTSISQNIQNNFQNPLKELFLIYIPLNYQEFNKELEFEPSQEEIEKINNSNLSLIFETINFSNVLCSISEENNSIFVDVYSSSNFPLIKLKNIINEKIKKYNFITDFQFNERKNDKECTEQNFKIISNNFVSINLLLLSYKIIETIFELDNNYAAI